MLGRPINWISCLGAGEGALRPVKLFVALVEANVHLKFPDQIGPMVLLCKLLALPTSPFKQHWDTLHSGVVASTSGQMGLEGTLHSEWGCDSASCLGMG